MKTIESNRTVTNNTDFKTHTFGIKSKNLSHIIHIIRDQIYSDKVLAVIREYACNASDANVMSGKPTTPIIVTLPSKLDPTFKVRDYGTGLSEQDIIDIFISYGESTKRNTNDAIGTLGIGSKCGFAYGDNFIVTSYNNGIKTVYDCILDKSNVGNCLVLMSEPMGKGDKEGIEVSVNVKKEDVEEFRTKAIKFFKFWTVKPELLGFTKEELEEKEKTVLFSGSNWTIYQSNSSSYYSRSEDKSMALMGNIAYPIDWENVKLPTTKGALSEKVVEYLKNCDLVIHFKIGDVQFAPSREALQYTDHTHAGINKAIKTIMAELDAVVTAKFNDCKNLFEAKSLFGTLFGDGYSYSSSHFGGLKQYFEEKGLLWNGIKIDGCHIEGFNHYDLNKGYCKGGHTYKDYNDMGSYPINRYQTTNGSMLKLMKGNRHGATDLKCSDKTLVMLYDSTKNNYVRKACHYLMAKNPSISTVYVLDFKGNKTLQDQCFKDLQLDLIPITKYSDIVDDVKKTITRSGSNGSNGSRTISNRAPDVRVAKYVIVKDNTYGSSYRRRNRGGDCWTAVDVDFKNETGYYVEMDSNDIKWQGKDDGVTCIQNACQVIEQLNKIGVTNITKVYGFGSRILTGKAFDKTKWIRLEDVITEKFAELVKDDNFKWYTAFKKVAQQFTDHNQMPSWTLVTSLAKKVSNKNSAIVKLAELIKNHKSTNTESYDNLVNKVGSKIKCDAEVTLISDLIKTIIKSYPMLMLARSYQSAYSIDANDSDAKKITIIAQYIDVIDGVNNI